MENCKVLWINEAPAEKSCIFAGLNKKFLQKVHQKISTVRDRNTYWYKKKAVPKDGFPFCYDIYFTIERIRVIRVLVRLTDFFSAIRAEKPSQ